MLKNQSALWSSKRTKEEMVAAVMPSLTAELFTLPLAGGRYLVYAPLRRAAFIGNARAVNVLADLQAGRHDAGANPGEDYVEFLQGMELFEAGPERPPLTLCEAAPAPTTVTLFLTTACNLRCISYLRMRPSTRQRMTELLDSAAQSPWFVRYGVSQ